jgi:hypothetical protein
MKKAIPVWQVIVGLSRYPFFNHRTRRTHGNESSHRDAMLPWFRCVPWFLALRRQERIGVVAAPQYRAAANTAMGWKKSNLRTEMTRLLRLADFSGSPDVATCHQTVEALLAPLPPLGSGWLRCESRRCASPDVATCRQTVEALLAPLPPLGSGWLRCESRRFESRRCASPDVATCHQTVEALLAPLSTAWQRMATIRKQKPN